MEVIGAIGAIGAISLPKASPSGKSCYNCVKHFWWWCIGRCSCKVLFENCNSGQIYKLILVLAEQAFVRRLKHVQMFPIEGRVFYIPTMPFTMTSDKKYHIHPLKNGSSDVIGYEFWSRSRWELGLWTNIEQIFHSYPRNRVHPS